MNVKLIAGLIILGLLLYFLTPLGSLISESSAFTQCTKVSDTEATCNFYNRGVSPGISHDTVEMPRFNEWAGKNGITYDKCKVTSVSVGTAGGCSCGPGSGSFGCACRIPQSTSLNTVYDAVGDACPITWNVWWTSGDATNTDNGGNGVSYSGTVVFFSETPKCGSQITCGEWSACASWHEKHRICTDECNIQTTEKAYCDPSVPSVIEPPVVEPPITPPMNLLDYIIFTIRNWLSRIGINL